MFSSAGLRLSQPEYHGVSVVTSMLQRFLGAKMTELQMSMMSQGRMMKKERLVEGRRRRWWACSLHILQSL